MSRKNPGWQRCCCGKPQELGPGHISRWKSELDLDQVEVQLLMQEELKSLSNFNKYLGFTQAEVDEALAGFEEMERELMEGQG